jgi:hypothetical protein
MKADRRWLILLLASTLFLANCATLARSRTQRIPVTSTPAGAAVVVDGQPIGVTPILISLSRRQKDPVIRIESPGYDPVEIRPTRRVAGRSIPGNILLGLVCAYAVPIIQKSGFDTGEMGAFYLGIALRTVGFAGLFEVLDLGSKNGYEFQPRELFVTLKRTEGQPRVDSILLDADEFESLKWIRVRRD